MAGVPLLYIAFNAINLEPPSEASRTKADAKIHDMLTPSTHERVALNELKKASDGLVDEDSGMRKRKRKIRGPNPLSCKKKQKKAVAAASGPSEDKQKKKRKRRRKYSTAGVVSLNSLTT